MAAPPLRSQVDRAIVLRHVDYQESDRVVTVFTQGHGRLAGLAKGVRRSVKRFAGHLDLFSEVELTFRPGRGELFHFDQGTLIQAHLGIRNDLLAIAWAGYLSELTEKLFGEHEPHPDVYTLLSFALHALDAPDGAREGPLRALELRLLWEAGLLPELTVCGLCRQGVDTGLEFRFVASRGTLLCERCSPLEPEVLIPAGAISLLGASLEMPLERLPGLQFSAVEARGARVLVGGFVRHHVGRLRTTEFLEGLEVR